MNKFFFMRSALELISQGVFFSKIFAIALRVLAVVVIVAGIISWIAAWRIVFKLPAAGILGGIIFQLLFAVAIYMVVHILFIRSRNILDLPVAEFTVIPISSILLKLIGEICACFVTVIAVGGGILIWFAGEDSWYLLRNVVPLNPFSRFVGGAFSFLGGLSFIIFGVLIAFLALVYFYLIAESIVVIVDIAKNAKATRQIAEQYDKTKQNI